MVSGNSWFVLYHAVNVGLKIFLYIGVPLIWAYIWLQRREKKKKESKSKVKNENKAKVMLTYLETSIAVNKESLKEKGIKYKE